MNPVLYLSLLKWTVATSDLFSADQFSAHHWCVRFCVLFIFCLLLEQDFKDMRLLMKTRLIRVQRPLHHPHHQKQ